MLGAPILCVLQAWEIIVSTIGVVAAIAAIFAASWTYGPLTVFAYYGIPLLIVNSNLVLITLLQVRSTRGTHSVIPVNRSHRCASSCRITFATAAHRRPRPPLPWPILLLARWRRLNH